MAEEFKPSVNSTIREFAQYYADNHIALKLKDPERMARDRATFVSTAIREFKDIADVPGSMISLFIPDDDGKTPIAKVFADTEGLDDIKGDASIRTVMGHIRNMGHELKGFVSDKDNRKSYLPDEKADTERNQKIFGRKTPPKPKSGISINPDPKPLTEMFTQLGELTKSEDFNTRMSARATLFGMLTGLRPSAIVNLQMHEYKPTKGALYIAATEAGAKGRSVNIPLNALADSLLQDSIRDLESNGLTMVEGEPTNIFQKFSKAKTPTLTKITSPDVNNILRGLTFTEDITYDAESGKFFKSLLPEDFSGKKGSALLRNIHATILLKQGVPAGRVAYLQGRSLLQADLGPIGELGTYAQEFPFAVSEYDRGNATVMLDYFRKSIKDLKLPETSFPQLNTNRLLETDVAYSDYFKMPEKENIMPKESYLNPNKADKDGFVANASQFPKSLQEKLQRQKFTIVSQLIDKAKDVGDKGAKVVLGALGVEAARQLVTDPAAFAKEMIAEKGAEIGLKAAGLGAKAVAAGPTAIVESLRPSKIEPSVLKTDEDLARERNFLEDDLVTDEEPNFLNQQPIQENTNAGQ